MVSEEKTMVVISIGRATILWGLLLSSLSLILLSSVILLLRDEGAISHGSSDSVTPPSPDTDDSTQDLVSGRKLNDLAPCDFDSDCLWNSCRHGVCMPKDGFSDSFECVHYSECRSGVCQSGKCSSGYPVLLFGNVEYDLGELKDFVQYGMDHWADLASMTSTSSSPSGQPVSLPKHNRHLSTSNLRSASNITLAISSATMGMADPLGYLQDFQWSLEKYGQLRPNEKLFLLAGHSVFGRHCQLPTFGGGVSFDPTGLDRRYNKEVSHGSAGELVDVMEYIVSEGPESTLLIECFEENTANSHFVPFFDGFMSHLGWVDWEEPAKTTRPASRSGSPEKSGSEGGGGGGGMLIAWVALVPVCASSSAFVLLFVMGVLAWAWIRLEEVEVGAGKKDQSNTTPVPPEDDDSQEDVESDLRD